MSHRAAEIDWNLPKLDQIFHNRAPPTGKHLSFFRRHSPHFPDSSDHSQATGSPPRVCLAHRRQTLTSGVGPTQMGGWRSGKGGGRGEPPRTGAETGGAAGEPRHPGKHGPADQEWLGGGGEEGGKRPGGTAWPAMNGQKPEQHAEVV